MDIASVSQVSLEKSTSHSEAVTQSRPFLPHLIKKSRTASGPASVSVVGVTDYDRNVLLGPTSPKPNRPAATGSNTVPSDTRIPARRVTGRAGFFI